LVQCQLPAFDPQSLVQLSPQRIQVLQVKALRHLKSLKHGLVTAYVPTEALQLGDQFFLSRNMALAFREIRFRAFKSPSGDDPFFVRAGRFWRAAHRGGQSY
jgi:hypothetical protein